MLRLLILLLGMGLLSLSFGACDMYVEDDGVPDTVVVEDDGPDVIVEDQEPDVNIDIDETLPPPDDDTGL